MQHRQSFDRRGALPICSASGSKFNSLPIAPNRAWMTLAFSLVGSTFSTIQRTCSLSIPVFIELRVSFLYHQQINSWFFPEILPYLDCCLFRFRWTFGVHTDFKIWIVSFFPISLSSYQRNQKSGAKATCRQVNFRFKAWRNRFLGTCRTLRALDLMLINQKMILHFFSSSGDPFGGGQGWLISNL